MMGNSRTNEKGKAPVSADSVSSRGISPPSGLTILEGNFDEDAFDSLLDMSLRFADLEDLHRPVAQGIPETVANPRGCYSTNSNGFQNPQLNMSSNTVNTNLQGVPLLPDWNMSWGQQSVNKGYNAISVGGISAFGGESSFASCNRAHVNRDISGSSYFHPIEVEHVHTQNNAGFNQSQSGIQGNFADGFLSLRLGGNEESVSTSQVGSREISDKLKETALNELKMAWVREAMGQTRDDGFMGFQSNNNGFSNQFCYENQMTSTNNEVGFNGSLHSWPGSSLQQNYMQTDKIIRPGELDHLRDEKLEEAVSTELKMVHARKATGQSSVQSLDAGLMDFQSNTSGFSNKFCHEDRMSTNNEVGFHGSLNSWPGSSLHQNYIQYDKNISPGDLDHFRNAKAKEAVSTDLRMVHAQKATGQSSAQFLNAGLMCFQSNTSGLSNRVSNMDGMTLTNNEVVVHGTLNSGLGTSPHHILQMQQNDSRSIRSGDLNHYRAYIGNQPVHLGTIGGNSAQEFDSRQHNLNKPLESEKTSRLASYMRSTTANNPNYTGQVISQSSTPNQVFGIGSNMFPQKTAVPQVSWVESGLAGIDEPFPKRLGVEFNVRNSLKTNHRHLSPMGTSFQTTSKGQVCQFPDKGLTRLTDHVLRPSVDRTDGAPVSYPIKSLEPVFAHGQTQNVPIQLAKDPQGAPSANASNFTGQSQKPDLHIRPHHKRSAVVPHPASPWVQRQKIIHPTVHHSMPKPYIPVTTAQVHPYQTAQVHPSIPAVSRTPIVPHSMPKPYIPVTNPYQTAQARPSIPARSRTQPADPVAARFRPAIPCASTVKPRVPVANSPAVAHITSKDPEATLKLSGYKCFLCKRDLALTSEGPVYQPTAPPPVAILPCGHSFHDQCLQNITPDDQAKDPPCIPCAIGEQ